MQVDFSVELGRDDETLEFPWAAPDGDLHYYDLKRNPAAISHIEEASRVKEIRDFLLASNAPVSLLETAKCDVWSTTEINPEEEIFNGTHKFGSYVDLLFSDPPARFSFEKHERLLKKLTGLLKRAPETPAAAEFSLLRCSYQGSSSVTEGFSVTFSLFGYGQDHPTPGNQCAL